ncbi:alpha-hydroxyketone-type quorum-sensing autoinducer synthase [Actinomycetota bacterium Odt1-20B]
MDLQHPCSTREATRKATRKAARKTMPSTTPLSAALLDRMTRHANRLNDDWRGRHIFEGSVPGPGAIHLSSNDYLGLAREPRILKVMADTLTSEGNSTLMSGAYLRGTHPQLRLENDLAHHLRAAGGILCQSGWAANTGLLQAVAAPGTPAYIDVLAHMSLWEGARLAGAEPHRFRHNDPAHLRRRIAASGPGVILVDSVYSTDGSVCPLPEITSVAQETGCLLVVDESHALGTHGALGEGLVADLGLEDKVHFRTASLSKAFAGRAGLIACCDGEFVDYYKLAAYPAIFSSALQPHDVAGLAETLCVVREAGKRRDRLAALSSYVREELTASGVGVGGSRSQIIALEGGSDLRTMELRDALERHGVFGSVFCPPATPRARSLVRLSLHAGLSDAEVERVVEGCRRVRGLLRCPGPLGGGAA